jgi:hypothetical protein
MRAGTSCSPGAMGPAPRPAPFAATMMLSSQVPLAMASKTMRHSTLSTTTEIYGHLLRQVGRDAVTAIDAALTAATKSRTTVLQAGRMMKWVANNGGSVADALPG